MIEQLQENIEEYEMELGILTNSEIQKKEIASFTINGKHLNELTGLINEKIKISYAFSHNIIEKCHPKQINILRKFIEEYERRVELLKISKFNLEDIELLKKVTVLIDLLFDIDVSYYTTLENLYHESKIYDVYNYFCDNIDYELNYEELCTIIKGKGFVNKWRRK